MSSQHPVDEKGVDGNTIVAFCESILAWKTNMNLTNYNRKIYAAYLYVFVIYERSMRKKCDMIWYDMESTLIVTHRIWTIYLILMKR